jgi:hypothetical protein
MTKRFCDLCGSVALVPGEDWKNECIVKSGENAKARIVAQVILRFQGHPRGYGGPPDICHKCALVLVEGIVRKQTERAKKGKRKRI